MANNLVKSGEVELFNITKGKTKEVIKVLAQEVTQWIIPDVRLGYNGLPNKRIIGNIQQIVNEIKPDLIHIWGTESYWGLLTARGLIKGKVVLEIQGLISQVYKYYYGGLKLNEIISCLGLKEILKPSCSLIAVRHQFGRWIKYEKEIIKCNEIIVTQSEWVRAFIKAWNSDAKLYNTKIQLRNAFVKSCQWDFTKCQPMTIFTFVSDAPYKGLHILFEAVGELKYKYPTIKLFIAGKVGRGIRQSGYVKFLIKKAKRLGILDNISWLGSLNSEELVYNLKKSNVAVFPSYVESYSVALDEALTVGIPCVVSFSCAMPELANHGQSALYFAPGDITMCAWSIEKLFVQQEYADTLSFNSFKCRKGNGLENLDEIQLSIYDEVIKMDHQD